MTLVRRSRMDLRIVIHSLPRWRFISPIRCYLPEKLAQHVTQIRSFNQVEDVKYEQEASEFIRRLEMVLLGLGGLMGGASVIIVCFSIMLTAYFRREEIRVMRLVGATYWYIRVPLIAQGVFLGFIGSLSGVVSFIHAISHIRCRGLVTYGSSRSINSV